MAAPQPYRSALLTLRVEPSSQLAPAVDRGVMRTDQGHRRRAADGGIRMALACRLFPELAEDDDRTDYWVRHVHLGVLYSEFAGVGSLIYVFATRSQAHVDPVMVGLIVAVMLGTPLLLTLPLAEIMRDRRGLLLFYVWSLAAAAVVVLSVRLDGVDFSPLQILLFLVFGFTATAYPPCGVALMGAITTGACLLAAIPNITPAVWYTAFALALYTAVCVSTSANLWAVWERQKALVLVQRELAETDELTGSPNRRAFLEAIADATLDTDAQGTTVVCLIDLDGFKGVNDNAGHLAGDRVLEAIAAALNASVRETDTVARLGGDEFAVLAEATPEVPAEVLGERLRAAVEAVGAASGVTASVGVTLIRADDDFDAVVHRADEAMYEAKAAGGNRVEMCSTTTVATTK